MRPRPDGLTTCGDDHRVVQASAKEPDTVHPVDQAVYRSSSPRVAAQGTRYGHGACTVLWIKTSDNGWVLLPHGAPSLAVHLPVSEFITMLDSLRERL